MKKNVSEKVAKIKAAIKNKTYDWDSAVSGTAEKILSYPQALLWR